jgi:chemotaxis protein MotB
MAEHNPVPWRMCKGQNQIRQGRFSFVGQQMAVATDGLMWSLSDLMTLLLIFFIMLYSDAAQRPLQQAAQFSPSFAETQATASDKVDEVSQEKDQEKPVLQPKSFEQEASQSEERSPDENLNRQVMNALADRFSEDFYVRWDDRQPVIVLGERFTFDIGQAVLLAEAGETLKRVAQLISQFPNCQVVVAGHTDDLPIHTSAFPSNWELSAGRAASVAKALVDSGVSSSRLIIQGQAQFKPLVTNSNERNRRTNRRVEISLITD